MNSFSIIFLVIGFGLFGLNVQGQTCNTLTDLTLIIDSSGSIAQPDFELGKQALVDIVSKLNVGTTGAHVAVINFASDVQAFAQQGVFLTDLPILNQRIQSLQHIGTGTATGDALALAKVYCESFCRPLNEGVPRVFAIFTDGQSNEGVPVLAAAQDLRDSLQGTVFAVGMGNLGTTGANELLGITDDPSTVLQVSSYQQLFTITNAISRQLCNTPMFIVPNQKISLEMRGNQTRYFQMKTLKNINKNAIFEININNFAGEAVIYTSTVNKNPNSFSSKMITKRNVAVKNLNVFVPSSASRFYFSVNGLEPNINKLDFEVKVRALNF